MAGNSYTFAEILNRHRTDSYTSPRHALAFSNGSPRPAGVGSKRTSNDRPRSSHSPTRSATGAQDAMRSASSLSRTSQRNSLRSPDQITATVKNQEHRISDLSIVTQVRVPSSASQDTAIRTSNPTSGRSTPRSSTPTHSHHSSHLDSRSIDSRLNSSPLGQQEMSVAFPYPPARIDRREAATDDFSPAIPPRSPLRATASPTKANFPSSRHMRNSSSIDRTTHNNSVASSGHHTESETAAANSDVFSQDETGDAYESDISSLGDDEASDFEISQSAPKTSRKGKEKETEMRQHRLQERWRAMRSRRDQQLPSAPPTSAIYDMLDPGQIPDMSTMDFVVARASRNALAGTSPASSVHTSSTNARGLTPDLSRRPPSPELSDISDAESFDSAVPPPVSLTRDSTGPRYRNAAEQSRGTPTPLKPTKQQRPIHSSNKSSPNLSKSSAWASAGKTSFAASADARSPRSPRVPSRSGSITPSRSLAPSRADSLPTLNFSTSRSVRSTSVSFESPTTHTKTFNISLPSLSNIFGGFSKKTKSKKETAPPLPPLRKITFDSRGQKHVRDWNSLNDGDLDANEIAEIELFGDTLGDLEPSRQSRDRKGSIDTRRTISSQSTHASAATGQNLQPAWRTREKGVPRRTAWR